VEPVTAVLGRRIRRYREKAGLTGTQFAHMVESNKTTVSDIELGYQVPSLRFVERCEECFKCDGVLLDLYNLVNIGIQESAVVADVERGAMALTDWEMRAMPGLMQIPDYMRAQMRPSLPASRIEKEVTIRQNRQKILRQLLSGWFILDESVLLREFGGKEVMRKQLMKLEEIAEYPNLHMQVMPFTHTDHPGPDGPLRVVEYPDKAACWFTEGPRSGRMSWDRAEVIGATTSLNLIRAAALSVSDSLQFIRELREARFE
jgi:transcriptional regulator with XRE-family HTH domain